MPRPRALISGAITWVLVYSLFGPSLGWPAFIAVAIGAVLAFLVLMIVTSLGDDASVSDAAWRAAAPDLQPRPENVPPAALAGGAPGAAVPGSTAGPGGTAIPEGAGALPGGAAIAAGGDSTLPASSGSPVAEDGVGPDGGA